MDYPPPNGYFSKDFILYGSIEKGGSVARGYRLFPPDMSGASEAALTEMHTNLVKYLQAVPLNLWLQWKWRKNSDYIKALTRYKEDSKKFTNPDALRIRESTYAYFAQRVTDKSLHREHLEIYPTIRIAKAAPVLASRAALREFYRTQLEQLAGSFDQIRDELAGAFGNEVRIEAMSREDHYLNTYLWYNRDFVGTLDDLTPQFNPAKSIHWNCRRTDIGPAGGGRLFFGGNYHGLLVLKIMGSHTGENMIKHVTKTKFIDYEITVNCEPLDTQKLVEREEAESTTLQAQEVSDAEERGISSPTRKNAITRKGDRIAVLQSGHTRVFNVTFIIQVWAPSETTLAARMTALKQAVIQMKNAQVYDSHLPATALDLLYLTLPGNAFHPYRHRTIEIEDVHLANYIPFSASFTGDLDDPQALWEGTDGALVGARQQKYGVVQTLGVLGMSRSGKSVLFRNYLFQTADFFAVDVIVESGLSHADYTRSYGCEPIIIRRDGNVTLNYLDTGGLPLSAEHLGLAVSQTLHMAGDCGTSVDGRRLTDLRRTYLGYYIRNLYNESFENWLRTNSHRLEQIQREALATHRWAKKLVAENKLTADDTLLAAYSDLRDKLAANDGEAHEFVASIAERDITDFVTSPQTAHLVTNHAFACFKPEEYPQHAELHDIVALRPFSRHDAKTVAELGELLRAWTAAEGTYGPLFDGITNRSLDSRVVHFELGATDKTETVLKQAASLTIAGKVRQRIINLPRSIPKRFTWEEFAADLDVPNNDKLAHEMAAQLAKFNCAFTYLVQNYSQFKNSAVCEPLLQNTAQYWIFRQEDPKDVSDLAARIKLPESLQDAITRFPRVVNMAPKDRAASFCYYSRTSYPPIAGSAFFHGRQVGESVEATINRSVA